MPMTNILLDTHDITMASIVRDKVDPEMSIEDIEEAMAEVAIERNIKDIIISMFLIILIVFILFPLVKVKTVVNFNSLPI
jgi:t-SNARE complex subunit (syntaxin)